MSSGTTDIIYEYMNGALSKVKTYAENDNGTAYEEYNHTYDVFGNQLSVSVGNMPLSTNTYAPNNGKLTSSTYGNVVTVNYFYDNLDRIVSLRYNNNEQTAFNYTYNRFGSVSAITDTASGIAKIYDYDTVGRLISARTENGTNDVFRTHYTYDGLSRLDTLKYVYSTAAGTQYTHEYSATYGEDSRVNTFGLNGIFSITPTFDGLGRQSSRVLKNGSGAQVEKEDYAFLAGAGGNNATTTLIGSATYYGAGTTGTQYSYEYDKTGNLTAIKKNGTTLHTYTYDSLGQLTSWYNAATDKTVRYGYYKGGNLKNIYDGEDTVSFVYNNGDGIADRLMVYDGQLLSYDEIGNPLKFRDGISMTWKNGRQLATLTNGQTSASYDYDESGIRTKKTVNGVTTTFQLDGSKIVSENRNGTVQSYFYDENGSVLGIVYGGENYYFRKNFRGDVLAILTASGEVVVEYSYDPWGNILAVTGTLASTLGVDNPFRYRGYYYDTESCFYYLNSRYYDAEVCRFINADSEIAANGLYTYCINNPVKYIDCDGHSPYSLISIAISCYDFYASDGVSLFLTIYSMAEPIISTYGSRTVKIIYYSVDILFNVVGGAKAMHKDDMLGTRSFSNATDSLGKLCAAIADNGEPRPSPGMYYLCSGIYDKKNNENWIEVYIDKPYTFSPNSFFFDSKTVFYTLNEKDAVGVLNYRDCVRKKAKDGASYYLCSPFDDSVKYAVCHYGTANIRFMYYKDRSLGDHIVRMLS